MFLKRNYINRLRYAPFDVEWTQTRFSVHIQNKFNTLSELVFKYVFWLTYCKMGNRTYVIKRRLHTSSCSDEQNSRPSVHVHVIAGFTWQWSVPVLCPTIWHRYIIDGIYVRANYLRAKRKKTNRRKLRFKTKTSIFALLFYIKMYDGDMQRFKIQSNGTICCQVVVKTISIE